MAGTNIDEIFGRIEADFVELSKEAAKKAARKAQKDIRKKADKFVAEYYDEYTPTVYKNRQGSLKNTIQDYYKESEGGSGVSIEFGVTYDPSRVGDHHSNSWYRKSGTSWIPRLSGDFDFDSQNNGIPSATWIFDKFWQGVHPSGKIGDDGGIKCGPSSDEKMQDFFDAELSDLVMSYMNAALFEALAAYF